MDQFQTLGKFQSERLLFIDKGYHEIVIPDHTFTFCTKQPATREVRFLIFTESAPRPIQSSSCNVHYKDEGLNRW